MVKEFKINNSKNIKKEIYLLSFLVFLASFGILVLYILEMMFQFSLTLMILFFACFLVYLVYRIINLRYIDVESSGLILTIKSYHPLKKGIIGPILELPIDNITKMRIDKKPFYTMLILSIKTQQNKTIQKRIDITGIGQNKLRMLSF